MKTSFFKHTPMVIASGLLLMGISGCSSKKVEAEPAPAPRPTPRPAPVATPAPEPAPAPVTRKPSVPAGMSYVEFAYPTGQESSSLLMLSKTGPAVINAGQSVSYEISATNLSSDVELRNVVVTEEMDPDFSVRDTTISGTPGNGGQNFNIGSIMPGETKTITVTGVTERTGTLEFCATAEYDVYICYNPEVVRPALAITKTGPAQVFLCDPITYEVTVQNTGSGTAENVVITDSLPSGIQTTDGETNVRIEVGSLAPGASKSYAINAESLRTGTFTNEAQAASDSLNVGSQTVTTRVVQPVLGIDKSIGSPRDYVNSQVISTISVNNSGDGDARNTIVRDTIPSGLQFIRASDGGTIQGNVITWNLGTMAPGAAKDLTATFRAIELGTQRNTATIDAECADQATDNAEIEIVGIPALLLEVIDEFDPVKVGNTTVYEIRVTNQGSAVDTNIKLDAVLEQMTAVAITSGPTNGTISGKNISLEPLASLAPGAVATWTIEARADSAGDVRFGLEMRSDNLTRPVNETEATRLYDITEVQN